MLRYVYNIMWRILQFCGRSGPTGTFENAVPARPQNLEPRFFPTDLDADDWMAGAASLGTKEIVLTAHHEGGFCLWPTNFSNYSVAASRWKDGKGDVLREFADAANKWGIKIAYYLNAQSDVRPICSLCVRACMQRIPDG